MFTRRAKIGQLPPDDSVVATWNGGFGKNSVGYVSLVVDIVN